VRSRSRSAKPVDLLVPNLVLWVDQNLPVITNPFSDLTGDQ
jgi:hypothetical protein